MQRYVLTGTPGSGKTAILRQLEWNGNRVVEEAATDVIALAHALGQPEPHTQPGFTDRIVALQRRREDAIGHPDGMVFVDRSPVCTLALSRFLGLVPSGLLTAEVDRIVRDRVYARTVFFIRHQGFVMPTAAHKVSLADSLAFEEVHQRTYAELGFQLIEVKPGPLPERVATVERVVAALATS
jgi:predicted ATPase